jgi:hypothetical protein
VPLGRIELPYIPYERIVLPINYRGIYDAGVESNKHLELMRLMSLPKLFPAI